MSLAPSFYDVNDAALAQYPGLLQSWLPGGKLEGTEYVCGNIAGGPGHSFKVNITTGLWSEFNGGSASGNDPVSLYAAIHGIKPGEARRELVEALKVPANGNSGTSKPKRQEWAAILPVPADAPEPSFQHDRLGKPSATWEYRDRNGNTLGHACRFDSLDGGKDILPLTFCRGPEGRKEWRWQAFPEPRPLYGLDRQTQVKADAGILLVEGEKTADAAARLCGPGKICMTWPGGCKAVGKVDLSPLTGWHVDIWPDADKPGFDAALTLACRLKDVRAASVTIIVPPADAAKGWDLADLEAEGWTADMVTAWLKDNSTTPEQFQKIVQDRFGIQTVATHRSYETGSTAWELARELFPRIAFPWDVLPEAIAGSLKQLGRSCATSATPLPIQALCLIAAAIGRKVDVQAKESWREPLIFWAADIRDSGAGKTSPMWMLAEVVSRRQAKEHERFKADFDAWAKMEPRERKGMDSPRKARGYFATNMTLEGIHADLEEHQTGGLAVLLNELSAFIGGQNQYKSGGTDRESWLALHDGKDARISRARGAVFIKGARVQVCGGIQPGIFRQVFGGEGGQYLEDGTVFRCLFTYEPACHHELTAETWSGENRRAWEYALANALDWADRQQDSWRLALSPEAQARFFDWRNNLNSQVQDFPARFRGFMPKAYGYALRLAGAIHVLERFAVGLTPEATLSIGDMERGIMAVSFYLGQAVDALRLLVGEGDAVAPFEVSERSMLLARVLESLRGEVDNGRLAVGFIQEAFNRAAKSEEQMHTARALGSLLRSCGLTALATKHDANGKRRVCCLTWDTQTDSFIKQNLPSLPCLQGTEPQGLGDGDFTLCNVSKLSNTGDSPETSDSQSLHSGAHVTVGLGDNGDIGDMARGMGTGVPDRVTI